MLYGPVKSIVQHETSFGLTNTPVILSNSSTNETYVLIQPMGDDTNIASLDAELLSAGYTKMSLSFFDDVKITIGEGKQLKTLTQIDTITGKIAVYLYWQAPIV